MNRPLTAPARDIALLVARVIFAVVMFAHGFQKLFIQGIGQTTEGFQHLNIPLAIISASFVTVMEVAGAVMLVAGAMTTIVCALYLFEFVGAIVFVHGANGLFVAQGGAEYVMIICAMVVTLAAAGAGRYSVDHWVRSRQAQRDRELAHARSAPVLATEPEHGFAAPAPRTAPAMDLRTPVTGPVVLPAPFAPEPVHENATPTEALPIRTPRAAHAAR